MRNCALLGAGALVIGDAPGMAPEPPPAAPSGGFVVINGWVLPADYFRGNRA